ncbi:vWA domain-containing protein [Legionella anisa]|uniref:VWA domain-containing protein n=1 Tax=Legionella anisa TaxID=28082 RepID=A0AAX0WR93_9GAMM|nr:vWA domain-containing protein [Legionella anisa]AWN75598.1 VWA domain-containing protein [Legionella anisa]KTC76390.1 von Willebrand factor type A domain protein [Legionella anisa]MBN5934835.1 VWA domain-containing protein [Legionella anisa]MCW8424208.1 VWA domain-containing protein [Legionella anisa]MCW8446674.1 VWA domain-containing protein [Legionella anisa]
MGHLVNNVLRTKNMEALLHAMGIDLNNAKVSCKDERVIFTPKTTKDGETLATSLQEILQKDTVKSNLRRMTVVELITEEIAQATCSDNEKAEIHKQSCLSVLSTLQQMIGLKYTLDEEQEYLNIQLPSAAFAPLFNSLNYKYLSIEGEQIKFNIKEFLKAHKQELILIDGNSPLLFAHSDSFEKKKVFYAEKRISEDTVEVTPYFFVPDALTPPTYHFVLDTSSSMDGEPLTKLKKSVIEFADALFQFQPDAVINFTKFNSASEKVGMGSYRKQDFDELSKKINRLSASGQTRLFGTVSDQLSMLAQSTQHNNVLLFTDGENTVGNNDLLIAELEKAVKSLKDGSSLIPVRNKFFILSYGTTQPDILHQVADTFGSLVLYTDTIDFTEALSKKGKLQEWAAARELFTCRLEVTNGSDLGAKSEEYVRSYDMSGQFVALKSNQHKDNETLHLTITDSSGNTLLDDKKSFAKKPMETSLLPGSAKAARQHGVFALQGTNSKEISQPLVPNATFG